MRLIRTGAVLLALGTLAACDNLFSSKPAPGTFAGQWDGADWQGNAYVVFQHDSMFFEADRPDPKYDYQEAVQAAAPFTGPGTYTLSLEQGRLSKIVGGDAGEFGGAAGKLVITSYDAGSRRVAGELQLDAPAPYGWHVSGSFQAPVYASFDQVPRKARLWWSPGR